MAFTQIPANHFGSGNRPYTRCLPFLFPEREIVEAFLAFQSGIQTLEVLVEEPQPLIGLHRPRRRRGLEGTGILRCAVVPGSYDCSMTVSQRHKTPDLSIGGTGIEPASPTVNCHARLLDLFAI